MTGIGGISGMSGMAGAGGANPLSGMAGSTGVSSGSLNGLADMGAGAGGGAAGLAPSQPASNAQASSFGDTLRSMVIEQPSASKKYAGDLTTRMAAGDTSIDPHQIAIASAKAGVEIQMATRTISSAVSAVRTLFQMQV